jgi:hypothetical protein
MKKIIYGVALLSAVCIITACTSMTYDPGADQSLKTLQPCAPACWYGLEPGKSSLTQVKSTLAQLPFVDPSGMNYYESDNPLKPKTLIGTLSWHCLHPEQRWCGTATFEEGKLVLIYLSVNFPYTFRESVESLGPPNLVAYTPNLAMSGPTLCSVDLYWTDKQFVLRGYLIQSCPDPDSSGQMPKPNPEIKIESAFYGLQAQPESSAYPSTHYQPWDGFVEGQWIFLDLIPGGLGIWLGFPITLLIVIGLALLLPKWNSALFSLPLAFIAIFLPTLSFDFSDICIPTIEAMALNTCLCGLAYILVAELMRFIAKRLRRPMVKSGNLPDPEEVSKSV